MSLEPDDLELPRWCRRWLSAEPVRVLFQTRHISLVVGLRLADGQAVVIKVRPPDDRIRPCLLVQRHLWAAGFPCPEPLAGPAPFGPWLATAERFVPGGARLRVAADTTPRFARPLARLVALAPPLDSLPPFDPPYWMSWDHDLPGAWPPDPDLDLNAHRGPAWLEVLGQQVSRRLLTADQLPAVVGHTDWESQNLRWVGRRLHVVHDWDSLAIRPEAAIAGAAAIVFPATGTLNEQATLAQSAAFLDAYQQARGRPWSDEEWQVAWAAGLWVQAFKAKKAAATGRGTWILDPLEAERRERLRRAGA